MSLCCFLTFSSSWTKILRGQLFKSQKVRQDCAQLVHLCCFLDQWSECSTPRQGVHNETTRAWILDGSLHDHGNFSSQFVVTCANTSETIMLPMSEILKPNGTITINSPPTIARFQEGLLTSEETCPATEDMTAKSCPGRSDECFFNPKYNDTFFYLMFTIFSA